MPTIAEVVARRTDLSTFIVHFTRSYDNRSAKENLEDILQNRMIKAVSPYGQAVDQLNKAIKAGKANQNDLDSQKVICFTETPLEHIHLFFSKISDLKRKCEYEPYGIALTKKVARKNQINPIWYIDITPGYTWLTNPINNIIKEAIAKGNFSGSDIAQLTPFFEQMGTQPGSYKKEFWWEREWRHVGTFLLPPRMIVLAPVDEHEHFKSITDQFVPQGYFKSSYIDPRWGLEEIIARLAGFNPDEVGPF